MHSFVGQNTLRFSIDETLFYDQLRARSTGIQLVTRPMTVVVEMPFYDSIWWPQCVAKVRDLLAPNYVVYVDASNDTLFDDPLHRSVLAAAQFMQRLGSLFGPDIANLSAHSAAAFAQGSLSS
jgi:hypothetical protein